MFCPTQQKSNIKYRYTIYIFGANETRNFNGSLQGASNFFFIQSFCSYGVWRLCFVLETLKTASTIA